MPLYVDDIILFTSDVDMLTHAKTKLMENSDMHALGDLEFIVWICVKHDRSNKKIYLDQSAYCERVLKKFGFEGANPVKMPIT